MSHDKDFRAALLQYCHDLAWQPFWENKLLTDAAERANRDAIELSDAILLELRDHPQLAESVGNIELQVSPCEAWAESVALAQDRNPGADLDLAILLAESNNPALPALADAFENDPDRLREACAAVGQRSGHAAAARADVVELVARQLQILRDTEERTIRDAARQLAERQRERKLWDEIGRENRRT